MLVKTSTIAMLMAVAAVSAKPSPQAGDVEPDFGLCDPSMKFAGGLGGRPADEFTFIPVDPVVAQGQQEALNPNIITNRICDQLTNVCEANDAAKTLCTDAQAQIEALGTRDQSTADTWNDLLAGGSSADVAELKKRSEGPGRRAIAFKACSTDAWLDDCTGWPRKREEPVESKKAKRAIAFKACSTDAWLDDCTGWP